MKYTSAEAAKLLKKLNEEIQQIKDMERNTFEFRAALGEDVESVRPDYNYAQIQMELEKLEKDVRTVKHAINIFNITHEVPGTGMTIDQILIRIPQLSEKKEKFRDMSQHLPKQRVSDLMPVRRYGSASSIIDYTYVNYDIAEAKADYQHVSDELAKMQTALDLLNSTETMEIEL